MGKYEDNPSRKERFKRFFTPKHIIMLCVLLILIVVGIIILAIKIENDKPLRISYNEYLEYLENGDINFIIYSPDEDYMTIALHDDKSRTMTEAERDKYDVDDKYTRRAIYPGGDNFREELLSRGVIVSESKTTSSSLFEKFGSLIISMIVLVIFAFALRRMSPMANGAEYVTQIMADKIDVSFDDIIGHEEVKSDLILLVKQIKNGAKTNDLTHGILFEGASGTGKTMLAKAVAHESGLNFVSVSSSNLTELYVGMGAKRVRDAFKKARSLTPCVLFFDEIDAVGIKRGMQNGNREYDQTINALLTELDGFGEKGEIIVIAATNRADDLDPALLRSGRFDRKIVIDLPKRWETRQELFEHYLKSIPLADSVNTETLAKQTVGFSGADIASVCREARLIALREDKELITHAFLEEAIDKMVFKGNRSNDQSHYKDLEYVAYHEAGHAIMTLLRGKDISRISILGMTSGVGGAVFQTDKDSAFETKEDIESQIMIAYAGRASEQIHFGDNKITQGATNDITQATNLLNSYVSKLGFDDKIGLVDMSVQNSAILDNRVFDRISELSLTFYSEAHSLLSQNYVAVERLAAKLLEVKTLSGDEAKEIFLAQ